MHTHTLPIHIRKMYTNTLLDIYVCIIIPLLYLYFHLYFSVNRRLIKVDISPVERQQRLMERVKQLSMQDAGPCGGFSRMYAAMCDYYSLPYLEEVAWVC